MLVKLQSTIQGPDPRVFDQERPVPPYDHLSQDDDIWPRKTPRQTVTNLVRYTVMVDDEMDRAVSWTFVNMIKVYMLGEIRSCHTLLRVHTV
jgi:hypothetical protein